MDNLNLNDASPLLVLIYFLGRALEAMLVYFSKRLKTTETVAVKKLELEHSKDDTYTGYLRDVLKELQATNQALRTENDSLKRQVLEAERQTTHWQTEYQKLLRE